MLIYNITYRFEQLLLRLAIVRRAEGATRENGQSTS